MYTEGLGHCKISKDTAANRTRNLSCCNVVSQPTVLLVIYEKHVKKNCKNGALQLSHFEKTSCWSKKTVSCVAVQTQAQPQRGWL